MRYKLVYTNRAIKDIQKLDPEIKKRIGKALLRYEENPLIWPLAKDWKPMFYVP